MLLGNEVFQSLGFFSFRRVRIIHPLWLFLRVVLPILCNDRKLLWTTPGAAAAAHISQEQEVAERILFPPKEVYEHFMWAGRGAELFWDNYFIFLMSCPEFSFGCSLYIYEKYRWKVKALEIMQLFSGWPQLFGEVDTQHVLQFTGNLY